GDAHQARFSLQDEVVARQPGLGTGRAVTGDRAAYHPRRIRLEPLVAETPLLERPDLEVLDENVALRDELRQDFLTRLARHVERHRALVAVHPEKVRR